MLILKLTICWGFFALLYALLLRKETFFRANRLYLLGTLLGGVLLAAYSDLLPAPAPVAGLYTTIALPAIQVGVQQAEAVSSRFDAWDGLWVIYFMGVACVLLRTGWGIAGLLKMVATGHSESSEGGIVLVRHAGISTPFSFFKWVFIPIDGEDTPGMQHILAHERAHARGWHSLDIMLVELISAACWFHPLVYWYRRSLRTVHEYLADAHASGLTDKKQYGLLLIRQSQSGMPVAFANHFFQSPLKQRLIMLMKQHSAPARALRYALVLPLMALFIVLFQKAPVVAQSVQTKQSAEVPAAVIAKSDLPIETPCDKSPSFEGGMEAMFTFFGKNLVYPAAVDGKFSEGTVAVSFTVKEDGYIRDVHLSAADGARMPAAYEAEALRVVSQLPRFNPGMKSCKPAAFELCIPIRFKAGNEKSVPAKEAAKKESDGATAPMYPGGESALMKYLAQNISIPDVDKKTIPGGHPMMVFQFMVNSDGSVSDIQVLKDGGMGKATQEHMMKVINAMPKWNPAQKDGKPVNVTFTLPIRVALD